jgi:hypothetical protein
VSTTCRIDLKSIDALDTSAHALTTSVIE